MNHIEPEDIDDSNVYGDLLQNISERDIDNVRAPDGSHIWFYFEQNWTEYRLIMPVMSGDYIQLQYRDDDGDWVDAWEKKTRRL